MPVISVDAPGSAGEARRQVGDNTQTEKKVPQDAIANDLQLGYKLLKCPSFSGILQRTVAKWTV
jgi:hypothetical protein